MAGYYDIEITFPDGLGLHLPGRLYAANARVWRHRRLVRGEAVTKLGLAEADPEVGGLAGRAIDVLEGRSGCAVVLEVSRDGVVFDRIPAIVTDVLPDEGIVRFVNDGPFDVRSERIAVRDSHPEPIAPTISR